MSLSGWYRLPFDLAKVDIIKPYGCALALREREILGQLVPLVGTIRRVIKRHEFSNQNYLQ
jgi:hypothetical protein